MKDNNKPDNVGSFKTASELEKATNELVELKSQLANHKFEADEYAEKLDELKKAIAQKEASLMTRMEELGEFGQEAFTDENLAKARVNEILQRELELKENQQKLDEEQMRQEEDKITIASEKASLEKSWKLLKGERELMKKRVLVSRAVSVSVFLLIAILMVSASISVWIAYDKESFVNTVINEQVDSKRAIKKDDTMWSIYAPEGVVTAYEGEALKLILKGNLTNPQALKALIGSNLLPKVKVTSQGLDTVAVIRSKLLVAGEYDLTLTNKKQIETIKVEVLPKRELVDHNGDGAITEIDILMQEKIEKEEAEIAACVLKVQKYYYPEEFEEESTEATAEEAVEVEAQAKPQTAEERLQAEILEAEQLEREFEF